MLRRSRIKIRKEVLPAIAEILCKNFNRDQNDFKTLFPKFNQTFFAQYQNLIQQVKKLPNPISITRELIKYIQKMQNYILTINPLLDAYDFSFSKKNGNSIRSIIVSLRKRVHRNDIKGTIEKLNELIEESKQIKEETSSTSISPEVLEELIAYRDNLQKEHLSFLTLLRKRSAMVDSNEKIRDQLRDEIFRVSKAGKSLYRKMKPEKMQDYDISEILRKRKINLRNNH